MLKRCSPASASPGRGPCVSWPQSVLSRRRHVRQQRDAIVLRFGKIPIFDWTALVHINAQRRAQHDPLSLFLVYLYFGRFFRRRPLAEADSGTVSAKLPTYIHATRSQ
jgi:hypothetical protein